MFCISSVKDKDVFAAAIVQSISFPPGTIGNAWYKFRQIQIYETVAWGLLSIIANFDKIDIDVVIIVVIVVVKEVVNAAVALLHQLSKEEIVYIKSQ
jgi:hypothetical protein